MHRRPEQRAQTKKGMLGTAEFVGHMVHIERDEVRRQPAPVEFLTPRFVLRSSRAPDIAAMKHGILPDTLHDADSTRVFCASSAAFTSGRMSFHVSPTVAPAHSAEEDSMLGANLDSCRSEPEFLIAPNNDRGSATTEPC